MCQPSRNFACFFAGPKFILVTISASSAIALWLVDWSKQKTPKVTLNNSQKYEFCLYARDNKLARKEYVNWIEQKWGLKVNESTITRILQKSDEILNTEISNPEAKRHKSITFPELELALKEFILIYQSKTILSDALIIEKAKQLADRLEIPSGTLSFSPGWLQKFKDRNGI